MSDTDTLHAGLVLLEEYEIVRILGSGGFGTTYLARDLALSREVAIKEYFPRSISVREEQTTVRVKGDKFESSFRWGLDRFVQEAKLLAKFRHPNIVRVFRTFDLNGTAYIVLDYVHGLELEAWLQSIKRRPSQEELDELLAPLLDALILVHSIGVLHRDIKPANICVREETGDPVLLDFGASKYSMSELTGTTAAIVSRGYSPYEAYAAESKAQGPWTDIYGLAATVYRALTGEAPPEATERLLSDDIVLLKTQGLPDYRAGFLDAVDWGLRVQPKDRPQDVTSWRARLLAESDVTNIHWKSTKGLVDYASTDDSKRGAASPGQDSGSRGRRRLAYGALAASSLVAAATAIAVAVVHPLTLPGDWVKTVTSAVETVWREKVSVASETVEKSPPEARLATNEQIPSLEPQVLPLPKAPANPSLRAGPEYNARTLGKSGDGRRLISASVSSSGRSILAGSSDGSLRQWNVETGQETIVARGPGAPISAIEFVGPDADTIVLARTDGSITQMRTGDPVGGPPVTPLAGGFIRALAYSSQTNSIFAIATSLDRTQLIRWSVGAKDLATSHELGKFVVRSAVIARNSDLAIVVKPDETLAAFKASSGQIEGNLDWIKPATEWTSAVTVTADGTRLARGGLYPTVDVFNLSERRAYTSIDLGEQAQTAALAFSTNGDHMAVGYRTTFERMTQSRLRVVEIETGRQVFDVELQQGAVSWLAFLPPRDSDNWLAAASLQGPIRLCRDFQTCQMDSTWRQ